MLIGLHKSPTGHSDKVVLKASRITLACSSTIHSDIPDHGCTVPSVVKSNVHFPSDSHIKVHQNGESRCRDEFPAGYYWYSGKSKGTGTPPKWVENLLNQSESSKTGENEASEISQSEEQNDIVSGDEVDEEQDTEPETDTGQSVDT